MKPYDWETLDQYEITRVVLPLQYDHPNALSEPTKLQENHNKIYHGESNLSKNKAINPS